MERRAEKTQSKEKADENGGRKAQWEKSVGGVQNGSSFST